MAHTLNIIKGGKTLNSLIVGRKQYATVPVKGDTQFQIIDEQGKLVSHPKVKMHGKDLWVFLEEGGTQPDIILENYAAFKPVDTALANKQNATFATTNAAATLHLRSVRAKEEMQPLPKRLTGTQTQRIK